MASAYRKCKVCGKEYEYCHTLRRDTLFRWQDVACCPEHGSIYFAEIEAVRSGQPVESDVVKNNDRDDTSELSDDALLYEEDEEEEDEE